MYITFFYMEFIYISQSFRNISHNSKVDPIDCSLLGLDTEPMLNVVFYEDIYIFIV